MNLKIKKSKTKNVRMVTITFESGNVFSVVSYMGNTGYRYFADSVADAESFKDDENRFYSEIATAKYDTFLTSFN